MPDASEDIRIEPVISRADLKRFIRVPYPIYADDPNWVCPLEIERMDLLRKDKNPFYLHAEGQYWIACRGGQPVGRISAQIDRLVCDVIAPDLGQFGMFECIDDQAVADALFGAAEAWLGERGVKRVRGPYSLSVNEETGLLVDGFETPPMIMMGHAKPWYERLVRDAGYGQIKELYAYYLDISRKFPDRVWRVVKIAERRSSIKIRELNMKEFDRDLEDIFSIFNEAWAENWGFVPFTPEEARHAAKSLKPFLKPHLVRLIEVDNEVAAFMITLPDVNDWIKDLNGRLLPFGWIKLLWRLARFRPTRLRVPLMGVRKKYQGGPIGGAMAFLLIDTIRVAAVKRGIIFGEFSWILEDNTAMMSIAEEVDSERYKTYRLYEKAIG